MTPDPIPFRDAVRVWTRVGLQSFGGPAGMHRILVEEKRWISDARFLHALNYCMLLPGPEAQQLATYIGWRLHGTKGGLVAGSLFVLPGFVSILVLSYAYVAFQGVGVVSGLFFGLKAAVLAVVALAVFRIGRRVLTDRVMLGVAGLAFVGLFVFAVPFPIVILAAATFGLVRNSPSEERAARLEESDGPKPSTPAPRLPSAARSLRILAICSLLWFAPLGLLAASLGSDHVFVLEGLFFSKAAVVTFGGAYAVLAYVAQQAVASFGWLAPGEMLDGLGMAETTPGPLIQVVQFVGFMGAFRNPGSLDPFVAGTLGAIVTTWVTFVPCFTWILLGAPYVERLAGHQRLSGALGVVTAAVVGVISNLALWFSLHTVFSEVVEREGPIGMRLLMPKLESVDPAAVFIAGAALLSMLRFRAPILPVLAACAAAGMIWRSWS